jgi:mRNA interferase MazF
MNDFSQGDIVKIVGFRSSFLVVSKNAFIRAAHMFHVCPLLSNATEGPLHIRVVGVDGTEGFVICEQIKLIDPSIRSCRRIDRLSYGNLMNISDALQGIFEYD